VTRRGFIGAALAAASAACEAESSGTTLGVTIDCYQFGRRRQPALEFAQYCDSVGAGGIQIEIPPDLDYARRLRASLESRGMFLDVMVTLPKEDVSAFEAQVAAAREAGAVAMRAACLGGRRYEVFRSLEQWNEFARDSRRRIARALPIAEKYRIPLGLENHKDWTADELAGLMKEYSSEWLGVCLDTGNNLALLDDPMDVVERLAPYTINTHLKDMALAEYPDGLLLIEPVFGEGYFDLRRIVRTVRLARPGVRFTVEQLTRNPLKVPTLTERYWTSFPERNGRCLARTLAAARAHPWRGALPEPEALGRDARIRLEEDNVVKCLKFAASELGMGRA
jgi:sugar phosphate isomerase/epimerase